MSACPKCKHTNEHGTDANGWATCSKCGFLWRETVDKPAPPAPPAAEPSPAKGARKRGPGSDEYMPDDATDLSLRALSTARLTAPEERRRPLNLVEPDRSRLDTPADEAATEDSGGLPVVDIPDPSPPASAPLPDPVPESAPEPRPVAAKPAPPPVEPEDSQIDLDISIDPEVEARNQQREPSADDPRSHLPDLDIPGAKLVGQAGGKMAWPAGGAVADGQVHCPICGHSFSAHGIRDDQAMCPQCHSRFNIKSGALIKEHDIDDDEDEPFSADEGVIGRTLGGCAIDRKIGEGGMGTVYHGRQISLDRDVAVKILAPELTVQSHFMHRFTQEARSLAQINHPNILHVYDFGDDAAAGLYYMIMEFVDGEDLADVLHRRHHIAEIECLDMIYQAANGLRAAAAKGIIHRDIKPDNLMITAGERIVKVTDFGLAKNAATITQTNAKIRVGTPAFMSPEQCDGHKLDARSDMYSLGCTAYVALTGKLPFEGETPFAIMLKHKADPVPHVRDKVNGIDPEVDALIYRLMAKDREDRWDDWDGLIEKVKSLLDRHGGPTMTYAKTETGLPLVDDPLLADGPAKPPTPRQPTPDLTLGEMAPGPRSSELIMPPVPQATPAEVPVFSTPLAEAGAVDLPVTPPVLEVDPIPASPGKGTAYGTPSSGSLPAYRRRMPSGEIFDANGEDDVVGSEGSGRQRPVSSRLNADTDLLVRKRIGTLHERSSRIIASVSEGDRHFGRGRFGKAIKAWESVAQDIGDLRERELCYQKIANARAALRRRNRRRSLLGLFVLLPALAGAAYVGVPVGHELWADYEFQRIDGITTPAEQRQELEHFLAVTAHPMDWYAQVFQRSYEIPSAKRAQMIIDAMDGVNQAELQRQRDEALVARLAAQVADESISWLAVESALHAARESVTNPSVQRQIDGLMATVEPHLTVLRGAFDEIETALAEGRFNDACRRGVELTSSETRLGLLAQRLPMPVQVQVVDNRGRPLDQVRISVNDVVSVDQPPIAYRMHASPVQIQVGRPGYLSHQAMLQAEEGDSGPIRLRVELRPGRAWQQTVEDDESTWHDLTLFNDSVVLLSAQQVGTFNAADGQAVSLVRRDALEGRSNATLRWSRFVSLKDDTMLLGSMDGGLWEWQTGLAEPTRRYQSNLPVQSAARFPLALSEGDALIVALDGVRGSVIEGLVDGEPIWRDSIGPQTQLPYIFHRVGMIYVLADERLHVYEESGAERGAMSLTGKRLAAPKWLNEEVLVVPTSVGLEYVRIWPEGDALISRGVDLVGNTMNGLAVSGEQVVTLSDGSLLVAYGQGNEEQLLRERWRLTAPEGITWVYPPVCHGSLMVLVDATGRLTVHGLTDGAVLRVYEHEAPLRCAPLLLAHHIVIFDEQGRLIAYHLPD